MLLYATPVCISSERGCDPSFFSTANFFSVGARSRGYYPQRFRVGIGNSVIARLARFGSLSVIPSRMRRISSALRGFFRGGGSTKMIGSWILMGSGSGYIFGFRGGRLTGLLLSRIARVVSSSGGVGTGSGATVMGASGV